MDRNSLGPNSDADDYYFQNIREKALNDTVENLRQQLSEKEARIARLEADLDALGGVALDQDKLLSDISKWANHNGLDSIASLLCRSLTNIRADAAKKAFWSGFEIARSFPDDHKIEWFWHEWAKVNYPEAYAQQLRDKADKG